LQRSTRQKKKATTTKGTTSEVVEIAEEKGEGAEPPSDSPSHPEK
jgi:hypothetical protein